MARKILIDAAHSEETRVVVAEGNQTLDFDFENTDKQQITGNVYLAKVTRVEPSLQAAFLDYGGNRHGFLAFSEIHPDYYQIPKADKDALLAEQAEADKKFHIEENNHSIQNEKPLNEVKSIEGSISDQAESNSSEFLNSEILVSQEVMSDSLFDEDLSPRKRIFQRKYKIQEVIKVRQILLIQVTKEERGNKGAALSTFISIAGRYCVLMPNTSRGGGVSKKITNVKDRQKLKSIIESLNVSQGSGLIVRTAGGKRTKTEIKRDYEFLLKTWETVRAQTMESIAPAIIYEEGNLIKRAIRDLYNRDVNEIIVEGENSFKEAKNYLKLLMPSHAKFVKKYEGRVPIFSYYEVENYLQEIFNPIVQLKSGGYIVIGITEALVAIDVNSGRATKERSIEETALKTNLEAATEIARQLKLRDLAGLIVIDFIDMEERKNNFSVEKKIKECVSLDRARIQIGRISIFGLLEMSRQRLRLGMVESTTSPCSFCHGTGVNRSDESLALKIVRNLEKDGALSKEGDRLTICAPVPATNYLINYKRDYIKEIEKRFNITVLIEATGELISPNYKILSGDTEKNDSKNNESQNGKPRKRYKKQKRDQQEITVENQDPTISTKLTDTDEEEQKRRKKRRRRKIPKDKQQELNPFLDQEMLSKPINKNQSINKTYKSFAAKDEINSSVTGDTKTKSTRIISKEKSEEKSKKRTSASVEKTIESLDNSLKPSSEEKSKKLKEPKMGEKGWWDR